MRRKSYLRLRRRWRRMKKQKHAKSNNPCCRPPPPWRQIEMSTRSAHSGEESSNTSAALRLHDAKQGFCFTPDIGRQSILNRRPRSFTWITKDTLQENLAKERQEIDRKAQAHRQHAHKQHHNSRRLSEGFTYWDNGKIVDRGRGHGTSREIHGSYNPITNQWVIPPQASGASSPIDSANRVLRRQKSDPNGYTLGEYDPIHHAWTKQPVQKDQEIRERLEHTKHGFRLPSGHKSRVLCPQGVFDPIAAMWIQPPANDQKLLERAGTSPLPGKKYIPNGENWGQHDPISGLWHLLPKSPKYQDPEGVALRESGILPLRSSCSLPQDQGIYNPIQNHWITLPENPRIYEGRTFSPVSHQTFR